MPVPTDIDTLSTTAGDNSPSGGETPTEGDNYIRALSAFIAENRDGIAALVAKLDGTSNTGTVKNAAFSGTMTGAASWSGVQTFSGGTAGLVTSSTYSPTLTNTLNITSSSLPAAFKYSRNNSTVTVSGQISVTPTSFGDITLGLTLPVASAFTAVTDLTGVANSSSSDNTAGRVLADAANDRATLQAHLLGSSARTFYVFFQYEVK